MAVKEKFIEEKLTVPEGHIHIKTLLANLESIETRIVTPQDTRRMCSSFIEKLSIVYVPNEASLLKEYKNDWLNFGNILERIIRSSDQFEQILMTCLQTLYGIILKNEKTSAAAGIIFNIYDDTLMPKAIKLLLTNSSNIDIDVDIKKVITTLCTWLRMHSGYTNLNRCIIDMFDALRELKKYNLLLDIAGQIIVQLFISLIIPIIRPHVMPVVLYILSASQSQKIFEQIVPRIPKVIERIEHSLINGDERDEKYLHHLVDVISALMLQFPGYDNSYQEIEAVLKKYKVSYEFQNITEIKPWHTALKISTRDPNMPIGLVNLGNTCYMNSVLQALFMTKQFTHDILKLNLPSRMIRSIQQLISLLLYSVRPEIIPREVLNTRPQNFRYGHQQDSFEYLGYVLDQLYEEEKKCILNASSIQAQNQLNNNIQNGDDTPNDNKMDVDSTSDVTSIVQIKIENEFGNPIEENSDSREAQPNQPEVNENGLESNEADLKHMHDNDKKESSSIINTIIQKSFAGKMCVTYKCLNCSNESTNVDNFCDLQLSLPAANDRVDSLMSPPPECTTQTLLDAYFSTEQLTDDDKYYCEKCKMLCDGERNICMNEGPSNLILVVKHFKYDRKFHIRRKLMQKVYHDDIITLNTVNENNECIELVYKLYAAIIHSGMNIDSGHYYTFGADSVNNWYKFNDNHITNTSLNELKNLNDLNTPYILFYELVNTTEKMDTITSRPSSPVHSTTNDGKDIQFFTNLSPRYKWPNLEELSATLREYVHKDNMAYACEARRENRDADLIRNYYNKHKKSDSDQDPPSSCGGNMIEPSNRYIC